ncbi:hypothetical protein ACOMHN_014325 [Nucella lapillus]
MSPCILSPDNDNVSNEAQPITGGQSQGIAAQEPKRKKAKSRPASASEVDSGHSVRPLLRPRPLPPAPFVSEREADSLDWRGVVDVRRIYLLVLSLTLHEAVSKR